jgi:hypothetical protein
MLKFLIGAAAAFALLTATPAAACDDCKSCPHGKKETAAATEQKGTVVAEEKKDEHKGCGCNHEGAKDCKCGEKCKCASCPIHGKKGEKKEEQKKS